MSARLEDGFELGIADKVKDMDEIIDIIMKASTDPNYKRIYENTTWSDQHDFQMQRVGKRYAMDDIVLFKITEKASGTIAAYAGLQYPWKIRNVPSERKEALRSVNLKDMPPPIKGLKTDDLRIRLEFGQFTNNFGYNPEEDFHRKGTMVLPEFQHRKFGTVLTQHCNAVADQVGRTTYTSALYTSVKLFSDNGFKKLGVYDCHAEQWGVAHEKGLVASLKRVAAAV